MRIFRISQRIYKLQLLPIYQAKDRRFPPVMASYGQLGGRAASAAPFGPVVVAGLAARGSAPRPLGLARSVALPAPGFAVWVGLWRAASLLAAAFVVVRPACAGRCLGAGFWRGVVAPGGRRGLSPVLAGCLWDSICAPWPRLRAVAARWGASLCARGQLAAYPGCCLAPPLAAVRCRGLGARPGWVRTRGWCAPPAPSARPPPGGGLPIVLAQRRLY